MTRERVSVKMSQREWGRLFHTGVVKSLSKTVTEPITNSDSSYKRLHHLSDDTGLVKRSTSFKKGSKFDLSKSNEQLREKSPVREIEIHLYTAQGHGKPTRTCEVVDFAEGLSLEDTKKAFAEYAADKSDVSKGKPGRSLFGRGVSDVLFGHKSGTFATYRDGVLIVAEFSFDLETKKEPHFDVSVNRNPSVSVLKDYHLRKGTNGTCVRFVLSDDCRIPDEGSIVQMLSQFYMLRLINADPNTVIRIIRYRSAGQILTDSLDYDFPVGDVIENFSFDIQEPVLGMNLPPLKVEGVVCRADSKTGLPGREMGELRANGLLLVDDKDAVLDQTLLPQYENAPYLRGIFGIVRIANVRSALEWYLNNGKDSALTVSRDGFETKHDLTKTLFERLSKVLEPIYKREEERFHKGHDAEMSSESRKRMIDTLKVLNEFLEKSGEGEGKDPNEPEPTLDPSKALQFVPKRLRLYVGLPRKVRLYFKKETADKKGEILIESENEKILVLPALIKTAEGRPFGDYIVFDITAKSDVLHESGNIRAVAEGKDGLLEARSLVVDVISQPILSPPEEMEFRPVDATGQPMRRNNLVLLVNTDRIPIGRRIKISLVKVHGKVTLLSDGKETNQVEITVDKSHLVSGTSVARLLVGWKGTGWSQWGKVSAETKKPDGTIVRAEARMDVEQPTSDETGVIKEWKYVPLENKKCSDLVESKIYINSLHSLNNFVLGANQNQFNAITETDRTAQYRLASLVVEQAVFRKVEELYIDGNVAVDEKAPVTTLRGEIDKLTFDLAPKVVRILVKN